MILLQLSEIGGTIVWQELFSCIFVLHVGVLLGLLLPATWRLYKRLVEGDEDKITRLKREERGGRHGKH